MGKKLGAQFGQSSYTRSLNRFINLMADRYRNLLLWPNAIYNRTSQGKESNKQVENLHNFTNDVIREREEQRELKGAEYVSDEDVDEFSKPKRRLAFLDLLLEMKEQGHLNNEDIREETDTFMFEGHDTTATGIMWALFCIARHPDVQERLYQELRDVVGTDVNGDITAEHLSHLKYLECVLKESQRLFPSVPWIARRVTEKFQAGEHTIPVGTVANISIYALHHNASQFPDPLRFDPERFSADNVADRHPFAFVPFSAGPRNCIGQRFALMEEKIIITRLLLAFRLRTNQNIEEMKPSIELVLRPSVGVWLQLEPRSAAY